MPPAGPIDETLLAVRWAEAESLLRDRFGHDRLLPAQRKVIDRVLRGDNVLAVLPTGHGKSLCYQLPSQILPGLTIVVSPLISLMKDQCDALTRRGIAAVRIDQSISAEAFAEAWQSIRDRRSRLLYVAPERFFNERFTAQLGPTPVSLLAIDEAHCMSQWGHSFRPDYLRLPELAKQLDVCQVLALTATAPPAVMKDIRKSFAIESGNTVRLSTHRANLHLKCTPVASDQRDEVLLHRLGLKRSSSGRRGGRIRGATLIYVTRRNTAEELGQWLIDQGIDAMVYHAGVPAEERESIQRRFLESTDAVLIGTIAFGMGVDKPDIRRVIHYNPSQSIEAYSQEIGRGGRDGRACQCETLLVLEDQVTLANLSAGDLPSMTALQNLVERLVGQPDRFYLSLGKLGWEINLSSEAIANVMIHLQSLGHLRCLPTRYDTYRITPKLDRDVIVARSDPADREAVEAILSSLAKGKKGFRVNLIVASQKHQIARQDLIAAIERTAIAGLWNVQTSDTMHGYEWVQRITRKKAIVQKLYRRTHDHYQDNLGRLDQLMSYFECRECLAIGLARHFGHRRTRPCGRCTACLESDSPTGPPYETRWKRPDSLGRSALGVLDSVRDAYPDTFSDPIDQAKFLCGVSTTSFRRHRLSKHPGYGVCDQVPFDLVLSAITGTSEPLTKTKS
ncbi:RecQ family ATP-dependent DNA helicase [Neorhodopirellula pilleata]|uniref:ATP-dependent DNA helicase RecQ n=1 Tax=Neorhodopirellula pilleata TaxID=2714738 RepID=A0A5C6A9I9_9BACT|nr:RecQ family ATP-dependent DNA helicase [Neorhodopirellula pilleata]TWT95711.1 ATP-dependent DNA helicase RecQ [Neorhodopirellula pilleata]